MSTVGAPPCALTVGAGLVHLVLGRCKVARSVLVVSPAIVHGMLAGIGVTIALAQLHIVLGGRGRPESSAVANVTALPRQLADLHPVALSLSTLTVAVLLGWPFLSRLPGGTGCVLTKVPASSRPWARPPPWRRWRGSASPG